MLIIEFVCGRNKFPCRLDVIRQKYTLSLPSVCAAYRYVRLDSKDASLPPYTPWVCLKRRLSRAPVSGVWLDLHWPAVVMVSWFLASRYQYLTVASDECFAVRVWAVWSLFFIYLSVFSCSRLKLLKRSLFFEVKHCPHPPDMVLMGYFSTNRSIAHVACCSTATEPFHLAGSKSTDPSAKSRRWQVPLMQTLRFSLGFCLRSNKGSVAGWRQEDAGPILKMRVRTDRWAESRTLSNVAWMWYLNFTLNYFHVAR